MGYGSIKAQGLSAPPYVAAFMGAISCCWFTDRINRRGPVAAVLLALGGSGYMMLATLRSTAARYVAVWMAVIGLFSAVPTTVMWLMHNQAGESVSQVTCCVHALRNRIAHLMYSTVLYLT